MNKLRIVPCGFHVYGSVASVLCVALGLLFSTGAARADDPLEAGFRNSPASAKPQTWWHWMNGNVTKKGITADLEAMAHIGLGGAEIFNVDPGMPAGPVRFMSPEWLDMVKFAAKECDRLGLQLCIHNAAGWSSSGGPWNTPEHAMQFITTSEERMKGPMHFEGVLPQPPTKLGYYRDIAVLAFRTPAADRVTMRDAAPEVSTSVPDVDGARLVDGNPSTYITLPAPRPGAASWVQVAFSAPFGARTLRLLKGPGRNESGGELSVSDDGEQFRPVRAIVLSREGGPGAIFTFEPVVARFWRLTLNRKVNLAELELSPQLRIDNIEGKAAFVRADQPREMRGEGTPDAIVAKNSLVDLTARLQADGRLSWDVPEGDWTILRIGHTPTGETNHPAPKEGTGPECDKLSREAADAHWAGAMAPVLKELGPLAGKSLNDVLIDSYEVGSQNWSPHFREDFIARRGYDPIPWLPVMTGRVIESPEASERFLWDVRRTVCDLFAENYYGRLAELAHQNGLMFSTEPYGNGTFEDFQCGGRADIPMGEFWVGGGAASSCKLASSIAHIYGRNVAGAESFTSDSQVARWQNHPYSLKALGDEMYCSGINRFIFHRYAMQPWLDKVPGMTMGPWGIHFERTETWWDQSAAWIRYLTRCQFLLQQGRFVADVVSFCGEDGPNTLRPAPGLPPGYDYDGCNAEVLTKRMAVQDGRLVLPDGVSYRVLTLPDSDAMTPAMLQRLTDLVRDGAVVLGPKPTHSPSLQGFPACDDEVKQLAQALWGDCDGTTVTEHAFGKGRVFWGKPLPDVLAELGVKPDCEVTVGPAGQIHYIHRQAGAADIYFVASSVSHDQEAVCTFRVAGREPELWHPDTGVLEPCAVWRPVGDRTEVPLRFTPSGSVFVVFRAAAAGDHLVTVVREGLEAPHAKLAELTIVKALYGVLQTSAEGWVDVTAAARGLIAQGTRRIPASNDLAGDPAANEVKELRVEFTLNGAKQARTVPEGQAIEIPEGATLVRALYGLLPDDTPAPAGDQVMDITAALAAMVKDGQLHVIVGNALAGRDPALLVPKQFSIEYTVNGVLKKKTLGENQPLDLPDDEGGVSAPPAFEVAQTGAGAADLVAWAPGRFTLTRASGPVIHMNVDALPTSLTVAGPWQVTFPPKRGAPPRATFEKLISWPEDADPGVKYFSGTATYRTRFTIPVGLIAPGRRLALDLGDVQVIAEPALNGKSLGVLWKPPFRADVTGLLRPGENMLEVKVTNLWPNRLIGDEQFPADVKYTAGGAIAEWPEWLLKGTPRPEPRRVTFASWKHWKKDAPLFPSGLLGPVTISTGVQLMIPAQ